MAPRRVEIDLTELEKLCSLQCTDEEIAAWFGISTRTIERRRRELKFAEVMARGKAKGRISVRRMQMKLLEQGNATMGVWLGKQLLGQTDHSVSEVHSAPAPGELTLRELGDLVSDYFKRNPDMAARYDIDVMPSGASRPAKPALLIPGPERRL